jgi:hypothetical protein
MKVIRKENISLPLQQTAETDASVRLPGSHISLSFSIRDGGWAVSVVPVYLQPHENI